MPQPDLPAPHPTAHAVLTALMDRQRTVLADNLIGLYLYGSSVAGDFDPGLSDLDLLAVTRADVDVRTFRRLCDMHDTLAADFPGVGRSNRGAICGGRGAANVQDPGQPHRRD